MDARDAFSGTGFSREEARVRTIRCVVSRPTPSRLKPVPQYWPAPVSMDARDAFSGTGFSREGARVRTINS